MRRSTPLHALTLAAALALAACSPSAAPGLASLPALSAQDYQGAVADPRRPSEDRESDANRKPAELLAFTGVAPGQQVGDFIMGGGYLTRLMAAAVGPEGRVHAYQPGGGGEAQQAVAAAYDNVELVGGTVAAPAFPEGTLDLIITAQNLHDLYTDRQPAGTAADALAALHRALKPGGTLVVIDHSATAGTGASAAGTLHRIERQTALAALQEAGFVLEGESGIYARSSDSRDVPVFDPSVRGQTDQFVLRMRRPG